MPGLTFLRQAEEDLLEIWLYIAEGDQEAATGVLEAIDGKCQLLAKNPKLGPARPDIAPGMRYHVAENYLVLYREAPNGIEVVRVLHGARNLSGIFGSVSKTV